jgi:hemerythrin
MVMGRHDMAHGELTQFIKWKDAYGTRVELIDKQHLNILEFLNTWYNEVRGGAFTENVARQMNEKFQYLDDFTHGHLDFESKLLKVLKERCGFPQGAYREHLEIHYRFVSQLMKPLAEQVNILVESENEDLFRSIAKEGLTDVAKWWYQHIKTPGEGEAPGPDHIYRMFIAELPLEKQLDLLNGVMVNAV